MHYVVGDIHGCYDKFMELLNRLNLKEDDVVILLGDIIDRGEQSPQMLKWAMEHITTDGPFQMVRGNHEQAVVSDFEDTIDLYENGDVRTGGNNTEFKSKYKDALDMCLHPLESHYGFKEYMEKEGYSTLRDLVPIVEFFRTLPLYKRLSVTDSNGRQKDFLIAHAWAYIGKDGNVEGSEDTFLWERDVAIGGNYGWTAYNRFLDDFNPNGYGNPEEMLIHGHTPICKGNGYPVDFLIHKRERSINLDCGAVFEGGRLAAYCLETDEVVYVEASEKEKMAIEERKEKERIEREKQIEESEKRILEYYERREYELLMNI